MIQHCLAYHIEQIKVARERKKRYTIDSYIEKCNCEGTETVTKKHTQAGGIAMIEATSCGGVVIYRGKILALYKSYKNRYEGWVLPKGTVEKGEAYKETALREVKEEADVDAAVVKYIGRSHYHFAVPEDVVAKEVHWYLMTADNYHSKPQKEEYFVDSGYYKFHEVYHLLRFSNEKQIVERAYGEYMELRKAHMWGCTKYF